MIGTRIGRYEITAKLGEGGMGEELVEITMYSYLSYILFAGGPDSG